MIYNGHFQSRLESRAESHWQSSPELKRVSFVLVTGRGVAHRN